MFVMPEGLMGLIIRLSRRILRIEPQPPARPGRPDAAGPAPSGAGPTTVIHHDEERNTA